MSKSRRSIEEHKKCATNKEVLSNENFLKDKQSLKIQIPSNPLKPISAK
jgi:hypothetical protein